MESTIVGATGSLERGKQVLGIARSHYDLEKAGAGQDTLDHVVREAQEKGFESDLYQIYGMAEIERKVCEGGGSSFTKEGERVRRGAEGLLLRLRDF